MKHKNIVKIYHADTDSYGIVWHGAYVKWFEVGRVEYSRFCGIDFNKLQENNILMPVVELHTRYKRTAKAFDELCIETDLTKMTKASLTFTHIVTNIHTNELILEAYTTVVTTTQDGKLYRTIPEPIYSSIKNLYENK